MPGGESDAQDNVSHGKCAVVCGDGLGGGADPGIDQRVKRGGGWRGEPEVDGGAGDFDFFSVAQAADGDAYREEESDAERPTRGEYPEWRRRHQRNSVHETHEKARKWIGEHAEVTAHETSWRQGKAGELPGLSESYFHSSSAKRRWPRSSGWLMVLCSRVR